MEKSFSKMKIEHADMEVQNSKWKIMVDSIKEEIKEVSQIWVIQSDESRWWVIQVQIENDKRRIESDMIESKLSEITAESAYFKDLLEKGILIRKELETKLPLPPQHPLSAYQERNHKSSHWKAEMNIK